MRLKKYEKYVELIHSVFFHESKANKLMRFGDITKKCVAKVNKSKFICSLINTYQLLLVKMGVNLICHNFLTAGTQKATFKHIEEVNADVHIANHYFTLHYYERYKAKHPDKKY